MSRKFRRVAACAAALALTASGALAMSSAASATSACGSSIAKGWYSNQPRSWTQGNTLHCSWVGARHTFHVPGTPSNIVYTTATTIDYEGDFALSPSSATRSGVIASFASYSAHR